MAIGSAFPATISRITHTFKMEERGSAASDARSRVTVARSRIQNVCVAQEYEYRIPLHSARIVYSVYLNPGCPSATSFPSSTNLFLREYVIVRTPIKLSIKS